MGAHSPSLPQEGTRDFLGMRGQYGRRDPITLAARALRVHELSIWIDIGDEDGWLPRSNELHEALVGRGMDHEFHVFPGDHDGGYWSTHIAE